MFFEDLLKKPGRSALMIYKKNLLILFSFFKKNKKAGIHFKT